jgi:3-isopropylmalate/(R)-2-methylmalate dehydratase large subunit
VTAFKPMVSRPGEPHNTVNVSEVSGVKIDSAFIGSCTNGRMNDMRKAADILKNRKGCSWSCPENCSGNG